MQLLTPKTEVQPFSNMKILIFALKFVNLWDDSFVAYSEAEKVTTYGTIDCICQHMGCERMDRWTVY